MGDFVQDVVVGSTDLAANAGLEGMLADEQEEEEEADERLKT